MLYFCNLVVPSDKGDYTRNEEMWKWFGTWWFRIFLGFLDKLLEILLSSFHDKRWYENIFQLTYTCSPLCFEFSLADWKKKTIQKQGANRSLRVFIAGYVLAIVTCTEYISWGTWSQRYRMLGNKHTPASFLFFLLSWSPKILMKERNGGRLEASPVENRWDSTCTSRWNTVRRAP